jgi:peptide deformylase
MPLITNLEYSKEEFDKRLRYKTLPIATVTEELKDVALELLGDMYNMNAIGLAANQVGLKIRLCVIDPAFLFDEKMPVVMFNPEIVEVGEDFFTAPEGCLSLPDLGLEVPRFRNVVVRFLGLDNKEHTIKDDNSLLSSVLQHEIDHLDGVLMIDRMVEPVEVEYSVPLEVHKIEETV